MKKEDINIYVFRHFTPIQVRYIDIDLQGHVNNATFLSYIEQGRVVYLNTLFPDNDFKKQGLIIARTEIDYFEPIFLSDEILCGTRVSEFGNKSFVFENILIDKNKQLKCFAKSVMVCFDYIENGTILVPDDWKLKIKSFEEKR